MCRYVEVLEMQKQGLFVGVRCWGKMQDELEVLEVSRCVVGRLQEGFRCKRELGARER